MKDKFKSDFVGTGNMEGFCDQTNDLFKAMSNIKVIVPEGYEGTEPTLRFEKDSLVFDFGEALLFTLRNVVWSLSGGAAFVSYSATVVNGKLIIRVVATP